MIKKSKKRPLVIDQPLKQTFVQACTGVVVSLILWQVYLYLWLPVLLAAANYFGIGPNCLFNCGAAESSFLIPVLKISGLIALALLAWAGYNWVRFSGVDRRRFKKPVGVAQTAYFYGVSAHDLTIWRQANRVVVHFDDSANITKVTGLVFSPDANSLGQTGEDLGELSFEAGPKIERNLLENFSA